LVWPYPLSIWHTVEFFNSVSNVRTLGAFAGLLVLMAVIVLMRRKYPHVSFSISWYLITLAPVLLVASSNYLLFERYVLLPSIGFCIFLSIVLLRMFENKLKLLKIISAIGGTSIITAYIIITVVQIPVWKNNITLWDHAFTYNPYDTEIYTKLAKQFFIKNRYDEAFRILERARKINPVLPDADFYYALYDYQQGDFEAALTRLNGIQQRFGMDYVDVYCLYGQIYRQQGETEKAIKAFERALSSELTLFSPYCPKGDVSRELKTLIK
jgi:tetratricopeptide (TPR) repeat protein